MNSVTFNCINQAGRPPSENCQQCGATDRKLSRCARCHLEMYCGKDCQIAAWPKHKLVCHANPNKKIGNIDDVAAWCGKKFGELKGFRIIDNDIRILSHTGGFAVFLPKEVWRPLDHQVPISFPSQEDSSCWAADKEFAFIKVGLQLSELEGPHKDYASDDVNIALTKIKHFVEKNLFLNPQAYPDSESPYFSHGSFKDNPDMPRPFRWRLGGNFRFYFKDQTSCEIAYHC